MTTKKKPGRPKKQRDMYKVVQPSRMMTAEEEETFLNEYLVKGWKLTQVHAGRFIFLKEV